MHPIRAAVRRAAVSAGAVHRAALRGVASTPRTAAAAAHGHGHAAASHDAHHDDHHHDDGHHGDPNANPKHAGYETVYASSVGFGSAFWRRAVLAVAAAYAVYKIDNGLTKGGEEVHPVGKAVASAQEALSGLDVIRKETTEDLKLFLKRAADVAAFRQIEERPMHRLRNPSAVFEPVSRLGIPVGTQDIELDDTKVKSQYDEPEVWNPTGHVTMNPPKNLIQIPWRI
ncbi:hypothetical protein DFJ74DRAFT_671908 [Hyaloraphidium curvatum]|nr:hypothetical protein DFJ74DRAFT_671908 [Hyaloraphidium curvatum]